MSDSTAQGLGIRDIHRAYKEKQMSVRDLVMRCLSRIAETDSPPGGLNAVLEINPDALFIADALDERLKRNENPSLLFGIPVLLKDNINTADKMHTSAGSLALSEHYAAKDASIVKRLRAAGAVILGKANMTEFANYMSDQGMPCGYSSRGGQVLNPHNHDESPGGSSSGSAAALAAGLCPLSVGTETSGSIMYPAWRNGIVGIKPTLGLVGRSGIIPISYTLDIAGPMANTVYDAAALLSVMAGFDADDPSTHGMNTEQEVVDYTQCLFSESLEGVRIGINPAHMDEGARSREEDEAFDSLCGLLEDAGALLIKDVAMEKLTVDMTIMKYEFKSAMNYYLAGSGGRTAMNTLQDIILYNQTHAERTLRFGQGLFLDANNKASGCLSEGEYVSAMKAREDAIKKLDKLFDDNKLDVMLCGAFSNIAPATGFPSITVPVGKEKNNVPIGSYWIARRYDEGRLLRAAHCAEKLISGASYKN
ncbi:hypothetical protein LJC14_06700 [Treponema sp. OttesenSCG-928-L16]|nr:hypothetical protein [Treponema sp. OttesenSCG-928-L16]